MRTDVSGHRRSDGQRLLSRALVGIALLLALLLAGVQIARAMVIVRAAGSTIGF